MKPTNACLSIAIVIFMAITTACTETPATVADSELRGTSWNGVRIAGDTIPPGIEITLTFDADGGVNGLAACNRYFGTYEQKESGLSLSQIGATKKMCPELKTVAERRYLAALRRVNGWGMKDSQLYLFGTGAELTFAK